MCPMSERSLGGAMYFITFVHDVTRKVWVYSLKFKMNCSKRSSGGLPSLHHTFVRERDTSPTNSYVYIDAKQSSEVNELNYLGKGQNNATTCRVEE